MTQKDVSQAGLGEKTTSWRSGESPMSGSDTAGNRPPAVGSSHHIAAVHAHYRDVVAPIWRGHGFHSTLGLPFEAVFADKSVPSPSRYRAMACARQLFIFSELGEQAHATTLFTSLVAYFQDTGHRGFFYSVDASGKPLDSTKDLYTHAFVIFASAAYLARFGDQKARALIAEVTDVIEQRFTLDPLTGLPNAAMTDDFSAATKASEQNPLMHLAEAYLLARNATGDIRFDQVLRGLLDGLAAHFVDEATGSIMELPTEVGGSWIEPGHQFEWLYLSESSRHPAFAASRLDRSLQRAFVFAEHRGVDVATGGVVATLTRDGAVLDATQRIWAQTEYLRAMACHPDAEVRGRLDAQIARFSKRFLHADGWHECLAADGSVSRADMPSTTPYHLASAYAALR